ncbi:SGNH/GDSL hydrolase family protein [Tundrisphaera sp. TA3]|uniref:SGNH/GDSL hydrolase family protein n=1 Tax=Tundrisphaera sp. TA3 TaxID=3435775 RepID=UPI003EBAD2D5
MLNAFVFLIGSGQAFFLGSGLIVAAAMASFGALRRWAAFVRTIAACAGACLIAASSTPLPGWFYGLAGTATVAWLAIEGIAQVPPAARRWARAATVAAWLVGAAIEIPHHRMPSVPQVGGPVAIIGDSVSAGMGGERETWPKILARTHGVEIHDLSRAGSDVAKALRDQARGVGPDDRLVLLEIGGNDVLGATSAEDFERGLLALLEALRRPGRTLVMLELPLPPFFNRFAEIQRRLARENGVILVPKRVLIGVLTAEGATVDTIHLSPAGHALMSGAMGEVIRPAPGGRRAGS